MLQALSKGSKPPGKKNLGNFSRMAATVCLECTLHNAHLPLGTRSAHGMVCDCVRLQSAESSLLVQSHLIAG